MLRRARIVLPNVPVHVIQRGNNRQACVPGLGFPNPGRRTFDSVA